MYMFLEKIYVQGSVFLGESDQNILFFSDSYTQHNPDVYCKAENTWTRIAG